MRPQQFLTLTLFLAIAFQSEIAQCDEPQAWMKNCPGPGCPANAVVTPSIKGNAAKARDKSGDSWMKNCPGPGCPSNQVPCVVSETEAICMDKRYTRDSRSIYDGGNTIKRVLEKVSGTGRDDAAGSSPAGAGAAK